MVLGHSACGAIKGACDHVELGHLTQMLAKIEPAVESVATRFEGHDCSSKNDEFVESVATGSASPGCCQYRSTKRSAGGHAVARGWREGEIEVVGGSMMSPAAL